MAWSTPSSLSTGTLVTAATWNQDVKDNAIALRAGAIALASQAIGDLPYASSTTQLGRVAAVAAGQVLTSAGTGTVPAYSATPALTSVDMGGTTVYASRAITVDTGGVLNIVLASAAGDDFTVDTTKLVVEGDNGNVGIGTATPNTGLSVLRSWTDAYSSVSLSDSDNSSGAGITFYKNSFATRMAYVGYDSKLKVWNIQNTDLDFATNDAVRMTIASGGDVGIGIAAGDGTLHVHTATAGSVTATAGADDLIVENSTHAGMTFLSPSGDYQQSICFGDAGDADSGRLIYDHNNNVLQFWTEGTQRMNIDSGGEVGIGMGSTLPARPLSVYHATLPVVQLSNSTTGSNTTDGFQMQMVGVNAYVWNYEDGAMYLATNSTTRVEITNAGRVKMPAVYSVSGTGAALYIESDGNLHRIVSARRYKENIDYDNVNGDAVYDLRPVSYTLKDFENPVEQVGFIAEDVEEIDPRLVVYSKEGTVDALHYDRVTVLLVKAMQDLKANYDAAIARIAALEN